MTVKELGVISSVLGVLSFGSLPLSAVLSPISIGLGHLARRRAKICKDDAESIWPLIGLTLGYVSLVIAFLLVGVLGYYMRWGAVTPTVYRLF